MTPQKATRPERWKADDYGDDRYGKE